MHEAVWIFAIVVGVPIIGTLALVLTLVGMKTRVRHREIKLQEDKLALEERLRTDELNARLLRMDDFGLSDAEVASLAESVRQLREEVAQLRQEITNRTSS